MRWTGVMCVAATLIAATSCSGVGDGAAPGLAGRGTPAESASERVDAVPSPTSAGPPFVVTVRDMHGVEVPGARVRVFEALPRFRSHEWGSFFWPDLKPVESLSTARTDLSGRAVVHGLEPGQLRLEVHAEGMARREIRVAQLASGPPIRLDVTLHPGIAFEGTLLASGGEPVRGAQITIATQSDQYGPSSSVGRFDAITDDDGVFRVEGLSDSTYDIWWVMSPRTCAPLGSVSVPEVRSLRFSIPDAGALRGIVVDGDTGQPISDARLEVYDASGFDGRLRWETRTDPHGRFRVMATDGDSRVRHVLVRASGYAATIVAADALGMGYGPLTPGRVIDVRIPMVREGRIEGHVRGPSGPIANAHVRAIVTTPGGARVIAQFETRADAAGRYVLGGIPERAAYISAQVDGFRDPAGHLVGPFGVFARARVEPTIRVVRDRVIEHDIHLVPVPPNVLVERTFSGRVVLLDGSPAALADVRLAGVRGNPWSSELNLDRAIADHDGAFSLTGTANEGSWRVRAMTDDGRHASVDFDSAITADVSDIMLRAIGPARVVAGRVLLPSGEPATRAIVYRVQKMERPRGGEYASWDEFRPILVDAEGRFSFDATFRRGNTGLLVDGLRRPALCLVVTCPGYAAFISDELSQDDGGAVYPVEIRLEQGHTMRGTVVDDAGSPIRDARIRLGPARESWRVFSGVFPPTHPHTIRRAIHAITDAAGRFELRHLMRRNYDISVDANGFFDFRAVVDVAVEDHLNVGLRRSLSLRGVVVALDGEPVGAATVRLSDDAFGGRYVTTNDDGSFTLRGIDDGVQRVSVSPPDGRLDVLGVEGLEMNAADGFLRIELGHPLTIEGRVLSVAGEPLPGVGVSVAPTDRSSPERRTTTDEVGRYEIGSLGAGRYAVSFRSAQLATYASVPAGSALDHRPAGSIALTGTVISPRGDGQRWATVRVVLLDSQGRPVGPRYRTLAEFDGTFRFAGLSRATHRLEVDALRERVPFDSWPMDDSGHRTSPDRSDLVLSAPLQVVPGSAEIQVRLVADE